MFQDEPKACGYTRTGEQFTQGSEVISGIEAVIRIAALQLELPMAGIKTN
jgi:hypothetical protein